MFVILPIKQNNLSVEYTGSHEEVADLSEYNGGSSQVEKALMEIRDNFIVYLPNHLRHESSSSILTVKKTADITTLLHPQDRPLQPNNLPDNLCNY